MTTRPSPRRRLRAVAAACLGVALLATAACGGSDPSPKPSVAGDPEYVALGDSYTAVSGAGPYVDDGCFRSEDGYPGLLAQKLGITNYANVSCGGATSDNLTSTQYPSGSGQNPPQLQAVTKKTTLVTLGMGLNDEKLSALLLYSCYQVGGKVAPSCKPYLDAPESALDEIVAKIGVLITNDLKEIRTAAAPDATIVLVGYPRALADGKTCASQLPMPAKAAARYRTAGAKVNDMLKGVAKKADVDFIDMYAASKGHDVCSSEPWVNGQRDIPGEAKAFHPYAAYHVAVADKIAALLGKK